MDLQKQSTFVFNLRLSSKSPKLLEDTSAIIKLLENSANIHFSQKKNLCLTHFDLVLRFLKHHRKVTVKSELDKITPILNHLPSECSVFLSFNPHIINKVSFLANEPDFAEYYQVLGDELTNITNYIQNINPAQLNIITGKVSQHIITKTDILRLVYSYIIIFLGSLILVFFIREKS